MIAEDEARGDARVRGTWEDGEDGEVSKASSAGVFTASPPFPLNRHACPYDSFTWRSSPRILRGSHVLPSCLLCGSIARLYMECNGTRAACSGHACLDACLDAYVEMCLAPVVVASLCTH